MTALQLADPRETAALAGFLGQLLRFDKAAAVRLQTANGALAVFARLPLGLTGPLVIRTVALAPQTTGAELDLTLSAGQLLDGMDPSVSSDELALPAPITGPAWAGLLPPRAPWEHVADLPSAPLVAAVRAAVTEFKRESTDPDALAESIWSRQVHPSGLTLRGLHAAHLVGLLQHSETVALHRHPAWLRLTAPRGSVVVRRAPAIGAGLGLSPTR
jgi:hypothetical protein